MMPEGLVYDGNRNQFVPLRKAMVPLMDLAVLRGFGLIEVLRTYKGVPFALTEHLKRLKASENLIRLRHTPSSQFVARKIQEGLARWRGEAVVKVLLTGGVSRHLTIENPGVLYILFLPLVHYPKWQYQRGVQLATVEYKRSFPEAKSTDYLFAIATHDKFLRKGFDEVLYVDGRRRILEGTSFNFAIIKNKTLITPREDILRGVTMEAVVKLAKAAGLKVKRRSIGYNELRRADEAFTASTLREIIPVVQVDKIKIGNGKPGLYTKRLLKAFRDFANS